MDTTEIFWLALSFVTLIGALLGSLKRRPAAGAVLGFLLGPFGWVIVLCLPARAPRSPWEP